MIIKFAALLLIFCGKRTQSFILLPNPSTFRTSPSHLHTSPSPHQSPPLPPQLITFDATNTLFELRAEVGVYYREAFRKIIRSSSSSISQHPIPSVSEFTSNFCTSFQRMEQQYPHFGNSTFSNSTSNGITAEEWWRHVVTDTLTSTLHSSSNNNNEDSLTYQEQQLSQDEMNEIFQSLYHDVFVTPKAWKLRPNVYDTLVSLSHQPTLQIAVLSNNDDRLSTLLQNMGLGDLFQHVVTSYDVGMSKPQGAIFDHVREKFGNPDSNTCIHIGDNYEKDVMGALSAGWRAVQIIHDPCLVSDPASNKFSSRYGDYYKISSLEEVWTLYKEVWNPKEEEEIVTK